MSKLIHLPSLITSVDPPPGGEHLNIQISPCGTKIWVCIDGANVFRYHNLKGITIDDQRLARTRIQAEKDKPWVN